MFKTFPNNPGRSSPEVRRVEFARLIGLMIVIVAFSGPASSGSSPWDPDDVTLLAHEMAVGHKNSNSVTRLPLVHMMPDAQNRFRDEIFAQFYPVCGEFLFCRINRC